MKKNDLQLDQNNNTAKSPVLGGFKTSKHPLLSDVLKNKTKVESFTNLKKYLLNFLTLNPTPTSSLTSLGFHIIRGLGWDYMWLHGEKQQIKGKQTIFLIIINEITKCTKDVFHA